MSAPASKPPVQPASSAAPDPLIGALVNGRFRILNLIARGGMGKVYRAEQLPLGRVCALKVLNPKYEGDEDPEFQKRFFLEAATAAKLTHPNTVTIFDYGRDGDIYYIAMEYIQGRTLYRVLREDGPLHESRVVRILKQVCRSLREAHQLGVIHRDMKPANVVLTDTGDEADTVKVLDFGLVKEVAEDKEDLTQQGMFMGSPKYMAPEQILGNPVSPRTDVYSVGIVAYELLSGKVPFDKGASVKTMLAHVNDAVPPIREMLPGIELSPELEAIVERCVSKNPAHRFESMDALLRALTVIGGGPLTESLVSGRFSSSPPGFPGGRGPDSAPSSAGSRPPESGAAYTSGTYSGHFVPTQSGTHPGRGSEPPAAALDSPSATTPSSFPSMGSIPDSSGPTSIKVLMPSATPAPMSQAALSSPARSSRLPWLLAAAAGLVAVVAIGLSLRSRDTGEAGSSATRSIAADATAAEPRTTSRAADAPSVAASTAGQPTGQGAPIPSGAASSTPLPHASVASPKATAKLPPAQSPGKAAGAASAQTKTPSGYKASPY